jgi:hypothetical protein
MDTLTLEHGHRKGETCINGTTKGDRKYIDFMVSGESLGKLFGLPELDLIGAFGWSDNQEYENQQIDEFLGLVKPELETKRTCLYVCPECGDIGCGALTAKIVVTDTNVIWSDFGYENNYEEPNLTDYKNIGPFIFDKKQYVEAIEAIKTFTTK